MPTFDPQIIDWLMQGDPSLRWQVMRDLLDAPAADIAAERAKVATQGFGARILSLQGDDGSWAGRAWNRGWNSTMHALWLLRKLGIDPASEPIQLALSRVRDHVTWKNAGPEECENNRYFQGEVEPCINGQVAAAGAYFKQDVQGIIDRLVSEQLADGGWNCEAERGCRVSSFNTTICVLEALREHLAHHPSPAVARAIRGGEEYLLTRRLFHRRTTGEAITQDRKSGQPFLRFAFPTWWHYDVLRALEYFRQSGAALDERMHDALQAVRACRQTDGRWLLEVKHAGVELIDLQETVGQPSRWLTLKALRVLRWAEA